MWMFKVYCLALSLIVLCCIPASAGTMQDTKVHAGRGLVKRSRHYYQAHHQALSSKNDKEQASIKLGQATYYVPGVGSCGKNSTKSDMIVAVSHSLYDQKAAKNPNENPLCGKTIQASYNGKSINVTVVDRCVGCQENDLDLSPAAFAELAPTKAGRLHGIKWSYVD
ncbi:hypothetical protein ACI68E_002227 [Malassezia pachydermatis]